MGELTFCQELKGLLGIYDPPEVYGARLIVFDKNEQEDDEIYFCQSCGRNNLHLDDFYIRGRDGKTYTACKECMKKADRERKRA